MMFAPKIIDPAEVNGDKELPEQILRKQLCVTSFTSHPLMQQIPKYAET